MDRHLQAMMGDRRHASAEGGEFRPCAVAASIVALHSQRLQMLIPVITAKYPRFRIPVHKHPVHIHHPPHRMAMYIPIRNAPYLQFAVSYSCYSGNKALFLPYSTIPAYSSLSPITGIRRSVGIKCHVNCTVKEVAVADILCLPVIDLHTKRIGLEPARHNLFRAFSGPK